ncbi:MAG: hypothetical protein H6863_06395, partial [Rhodospirillales bacterium]|nr:hypothetical protein [Rhodospirillales bacterium]
RAAMRAAERALPLLKPGHSLKIMFMPEGEDPDTFLRHKGAAAFQALLAQAQPLVLFLFAQECRDRPLETPEERAALNAALDAHVQRITDRDVQFYYRGAFRDKTRDLFRTPPAGGVTSSPRAFQKHKKWDQRNDVDAALPLKRPGQSQQNLLERILLAAVLMRPELFPDVEERLGAVQLSHPVLERVRHALFSVLDSEINLDFEGVKSHLISVGLEGDLSYTLNDSVLTHAGFIQANEEYTDLLQNWTRLWSMMEEQAGQK